MKTFAELSLKALSENIKAFRDILPDKTKIIAVVKANAYGHGIFVVSQKALECGVAMLAVAQPEEGKQLRDKGITAPIIVMGGMLPEDMDEVVEYDLTPFIYTVEQLNALEMFANNKDKIAKFHLKIETGMNRTGTKIGEDLHNFLSALNDCNSVKLSAVCSHFANADELDKEFASKQYKKLVKAVRQLAQAEYYPSIHMANSAAAASCDFARLDYIRLGVSMYGLQSEKMHTLNLTPVMTLKTKIINLKTIEKGESVGYARNFIADSETIVATLPIGYADGFRRALSNNGQVLVRGRRASVIGNVCMDHVMIDVSAIDDAKIGDEVVIIGKQRNDEIKASEVAKRVGTIHYEIVTGIGQRIPRIYTDE